ncbi:MAG: hypothetical protein IJD91_01095 [Clostridia bacterium]|nr:hypothetical protein [Clostridia bacterium]
MIKYKLRKDKLVSEDNVKYTAYGIDAYEERKKVRVIKDISLNKKNLKQFVKQCKDMKLQDLDDAVQMFAQKELELIVVKPRFI